LVGLSECFRALSGYSLTVKCNKRMIGRKDDVVGEISGRKRLGGEMIGLYVHDGFCREIIGEAVLVPFDEFQSDGDAVMV
jgi:hypothetical protein